MVTEGLDSVTGILTILKGHSSGTVVDKDFFPFFSFYFFFFFYFLQGDFLGFFEILYNFQNTSIWLVLQFHIHQIYAIIYQLDASNGKSAQQKNSLAHCFQLLLLRLTFYYHYMAIFTDSF